MKNIYHENKSISCFSIKQSILSLAAIFFSSMAIGQLTTDNTVTPQAAAQSLLGNGIIISNLQFSGDSTQIGSFDCDTCGIGIDSGIILASGDVVVAEGPNNSGSASGGVGGMGETDEDLEIIQDVLNDAAVLEFDFVAAGDSMNFNYVWASEEYPEFVPDDFGGGINDVFGFFLSGPGISGEFSNNAINIAQIPGTNQAVSIANINNGSDGVSGPCVNCEFYINNNGNTDPNTIQFDGYTIVLAASASGLQVGQTYHVKIAIADASDTSWDSGVFIQSESLNSNKNFIETNVNEPGPLGDAAIVEGFGEAYFEVVRSTDPSQDETVYLNFEGSAVNGEDFSEIPSSVVIEGGQNSVQVPIETIEDDEFEGPETIIIQYLHENIFGEMDSSISASLSIVDIDNSITTTENSLIANAEDAEYQWVECSDGLEEIEGATNQEFIPSETGNYAVKITKYGYEIISDCVPMTVVGISENSLEETIRVYPNPTKGDFEITNNGASVIQEIVVKDYTGKLVHQQSVETENVEISLPESPGFYFIHVFSADGENAVFKVIKE